MKPAIFLAILTLLAGFIANAQPYSGNRHTRHRFAQLTLGGDLTLMPGMGNSSYLNSSGALSSTSIPTQLTPRLWVGGLHFWGHAEFGVHFPLGGVKFRANDALTTTYDPGVETIAKWYPWALTNTKIRPYLGFSAQPVSFRQQTGESISLVGPQSWRIATPLLTGITLMKGNKLLELGISYNLLQSELRYPVSPTTIATTKLPPLAISLGYKLMLDTTVGSEKNLQNGKTQETIDKLGKKLNGWFLGIGPSTAWLVGPSEAVAGFPSLKTPLVQGVFADVVAGYYWHRPDLNLNFAWRNIRTSTDAYGQTLTQNRRSFAIESTKYFGDYHGFCPFVGPAISYERLSATLDGEANSAFSTSFNGFRAGVTAGWDIRPSRLDWFYLRSNLRYFPGLGLDLDSGQRLGFQQLEVNFIQFVWMIGRRRL
ncbi:MAG: hypothetical protein NWR72_05520 [Bacteroidia bacterium]|nr:hypothetical protein [Bacteroidia bacterium]